MHFFFIDFYTLGYSTAEGTRVLNRLLPNHPEPDNFS